MQNDLTFFTNEQGSTLLDRFKKTLLDVKYFDILVGYFRTSGFDKLQDALASIDKIRLRCGRLFCLSARYPAPALAESLLSTAGAEQTGV